MVDNNLDLVPDDGRRVMGFVDTQQPVPSVGRFVLQEGVDARPGGTKAIGRGHAHGIPEQVKKVEGVVALVKSTRADRQVEGKK